MNEHDVFQTRTGGGPDLLWFAHPYSQPLHSLPFFSVLEQTIPKLMECSFLHSLQLIPTSFSRLNIARIL